MNRFRRLSTPVWRILQGTVIAFVAFLLTGLAYGWHRWTTAGDFKLLGALARLVGGALVGLLIGLFYAHDLPPSQAQEVVWFVTSIGTLVGGLWGLVWMMGAPPPQK